MSTFTIILGALLWVAIAGLVVIAFVRRSRRIACPSCGLSVDPRLGECPYCGADL